MNDRLHSIFTISMGVLLLVLFNPISNSKIVCVDGHTKLFLYIFGALSILGIVQHYMDEKRKENRRHNHIKELKIEVFFNKFDQNKSNQIRSNQIRSNGI